MSDTYTPATDQLRDAVVASGYFDGDEFDRWLTAHDAASDAEIAELTAQHDGLAADLPSRETIVDVIEREMASYLPQTATEPPESLLRSDGSDMSERVTYAVLALLRGATK